AQPHRDAVRRGGHPVRAGARLRRHPRRDRPRPAVPGHLQPRGCPMTTSAIPANSPAGTGGIPIVPADASGSAAPAGPPGPPGLTDRLAALDRLVQAGVGRLDQPVLDDAAALLDRAGQRLRLSGEHTVVTLAGGTGSGKSSLFNAICGLELSPTGMRRPMTSKAHACVWGLDGAGPLLDWL